MIQYYEERRYFIIKGLGTLKVVDTIHLFKLGNAHDFNIVEQNCHAYKHVFIADNFAILVNQASCGARGNGPSGTALITWESAVRS